MIGKALPRDFPVEYLFKKRKHNIQIILKMGQSASGKIGVNQKNTLEFEAFVMWDFKFWDQFPGSMETEAESCYIFLWKAFSRVFRVLF